MCLQEGPSVCRSDSVQLGETGGRSQGQEDSGNGREVEKESGKQEEEETEDTKVHQECHRAGQSAPVNRPIGCTSSIHSAVCAQLRQPRLQGQRSAHQCRRARR